MMKYHSNKLNLSLIVVYHKGQKQRLRSQLTTYSHLRLSHSLNRPRYQPVHRIHLNHYHISILYPRTALPALSPIIHIPRILVVPDILFIVLRSYHSPQIGSPDPVHEGSAEPSSNLPHTVLIHTVLLNLVLAHQYVPSIHCALFLVPVAHLNKFRVVRVRCVWGECFFGVGAEAAFLLLFPLPELLQLLKDTVDDLIFLLQRSLKHLHDLFNSSFGLSDFF